MSEGIVLLISDPPAEVGPRRSTDWSSKRTAANPSSAPPRAWDASGGRTSRSYPVPPQRKPDGRGNEQGPEAGKPGRDINVLLRQCHMGGAWPPSSPIAASGSCRSTAARSSGSGSVFAQLAGRGPHCLVYLDDLAFDDGGRTDRVLRPRSRAVSSSVPQTCSCGSRRTGCGSRARPMPNAPTTSRGDSAVGEKTALATRFGRRVAFRSPSQEAYLAICRRLVASASARCPRARRRRPSASPSQGTA